MSRALRTAVERCLANPTAVEHDRVVWGPRIADGFAFGALSGGDCRDDGPLEWVTRCLVSLYFLEHENEPATAEEIYDWVVLVDPDRIQTAVTLGIVVGLP